MFGVSPKNSLNRQPALALALAAAMLLQGVAGGQTARRPTKVLTPEQAAYQKASSQWLEQYNALRKRAQQVLAAEQARERAGDCPTAETTRAQEECLDRERTTTEANYAEVTSALRAMLALAPPQMPDQQPFVGVSGAPPTAAERAAEFEKLEAESAVYRKLAAAAAYNEYKGGTLAPVFELEAEQKLLRSHLNELSFLYEEEFSNR